MTSVMLDRACEMTTHQLVSFWSYTDSHIFKRLILHDLIELEFLRVNPHSIAIAFIPDLGSDSESDDSAEEDFLQNRRACRFIDDEADESD